MPAVNTVCRAPARATRVFYTVLTLSSRKFVSIFHDHSDSNSPNSSLCPRSLGFHFGVPILRAFDVSLLPTRPVDSPLVYPISLSSTLFPSIPSFSAVQRIPFSPSPAAQNPRLHSTRREPPSALVTAETPELLQRRRSLVSAGWRLHGHRGWLHGPEGGTGQTVVVHITRCPRSTNPYSRPIHRRRAA